MEKIKDLEQMLLNAISECCKNADCHTIEKIFEAAEWTWRDHITKERYIPCDREIRRKLYILGKEALGCLMKDYDIEDWGKQRPGNYTVSGCRLYFTIDWNTEQDKELDVLRDIQLVCGIHDDTASSAFEDVLQNDYVVETYYQDDECAREIFNRG